MFKGLKKLKKVFSSKSKRDRHDSASESNLLIHNEFLDSDEYLIPNDKPKKGVTHKAKKFFKRVIKPKNCSGTTKITKNQLKFKKEVSLLDEVMLLKQEVKALKKKLEEKNEELKNVKKANRRLENDLEHAEVELAENETDNEMLFQLLRSNMYRNIRHQLRHRKEMKRAQETIGTQRMKMVTMERKYMYGYRKQKLAVERISELEEEVRMLRIDNRQSRVGSDTPLPTRYNRNFGATSPAISPNVKPVLFDTLMENFDFPLEKRQLVSQINVPPRRLYPLITDPSLWQ